MIKTFLIKAAAAALAVGMLSFFGCSDSLNENNNMSYLLASKTAEESVKYGSITISTGDSRALDVSTITSATVTVSGYGMDDVQGTDVNLANGAGSAKISGIKVGKNRVVTVKSNVDGAVIRGVCNVDAKDDNACTVNWASTAVANVYYNLIKSRTDVSNIEASAFSSAIDTTVHASLINAEAIATDYKAGSLNSASNYILGYGTVCVSYKNTNGYTVQVTDIASAKTTFSQADGNVTLKGYPGEWKVKVFDASGELKETKDVVIGAGKETKINLEYGTGADLTGKTIAFVKAGSAPNIWAWEVNGKSLSELLGETWNDGSGSVMAAVTSDYMANPSGWYMKDFSSVVTPGNTKTIKFKLNRGGNELTGAAGTFWYDGSSSSTTNPSPVTAGLSVKVENPQVPVAPTVKIEPSSNEISVNGQITVTLTNGNDTISAASVTLSGDASGTYAYSDFKNDVLTIKVSDLGITEAAKTIKVNASVTNSVKTVNAEEKSYTTTANVVVKDTFTWDNANVYFVIQDRFYDGDSSNNNSYGRMTTDDLGKKIGTFHGGDIKGLTQKLDYVEGLGVNAIWITAAYEQAHGWCGGGDNGDFAHYGYHGYYPLDYTMIDKNMGTVEEFRTFVTECHKRGIRVVMDVVMNHTGYLTLQDCQDYSIDIFSGSYSGGKSTDMGFKIGSDGDTYHKHHSKIDYNGHNDGWAKWWGSSWIRAGVPGYTAGGGDDLTKNLDNLPDVKTENTTAQKVAPILQTKWSKETTGYDSWIVPAAKSLRNTSDSNAPAVWIEKWLAAWVEEFGIDGFRCDTAKHVDMCRWGELKALCKTALKTWRASNRCDEYAKDWDEEFWMTGECFGWKYGNGGAWFSTGGFDTMIDFSSNEKTFSGLPNWTDRTGNRQGLLYISSHDTSLGRGSDQKTLGTQFVLMPGPIQIYYGDETCRQFGETGSDPNQGTRSDMNWDAANGDCANHWKKVGTFRKWNPAVGAGVQTESDSSYKRIYSGAAGENKIAIGISGTSVDVSGLFADGTKVYNWYDGTNATVSGGSVSFSGGSASQPILVSDKNPADYGVTF